RVEVFDPEPAHPALSRFADLRPDPLRIPPNAATRADDRGLEAVVAGDWEAVAATCAPSLVFEDRRRLVRITGDSDMFIANCKLGGGQAGGQRRPTAASATAATAAPARTRLT